MGKWMTLALRTVLVMSLAGSVFVQLVMVPLLAIDLEEADPDSAHLQVPFAVILILGLVTTQVAMVCVWRLTTMTSTGTVFSHAAFRYVDIMIGAAAAAAVITFSLAVVLAPGDAVPPGLVLLTCGAAVVAGGIGLVLLVLRTLLRQAIELDTQAHDLQAELDEVI